MDNVRTKAFSISDQALLLLDDSQSPLNRKKLDIFAEIDECVGASFSAPQETESTAKVEMHPFTVAARLSRSNYEEQAKSEALYQALQKLRSRSGHATTTNGYPHSGRIIRSR